MVADINHPKLERRLRPFGDTPAGMIRARFHRPLDVAVIQDVLAGKRVTAIMACKLARVYGTSKAFWLQLQATADEKEKNERQQKTKEAN